MNFAASEAIANAVLFEGYILYPYRPSALKNRQRWNFGTLFPRAFAERQVPPERWRFSAQVLIEANPQTIITARFRFLQFVPPTTTQGEQWAQGFPRSRTRNGITLDELCNPIDHVFEMTTLSGDEFRDAPAEYTERPRVARLNLSAERLRDGLYRLSADATNESPVSAINSSREDLQDVAFVSAHLLLGIEDGNFVSLLDPPESVAGEANACLQDGVFPVLVGENGDRSQVLCSPIILYDYPQVAPESAGDFFDATEMDEMLALRVLTLTEEEKAEMRRGDAHARAILERMETLPTDQLLKVHGAIRGLRTIAGEPPAAETVSAWDPYFAEPAVDSVRVFGIELRKGDRVRLWPQKKADIFDMAMEGKIAVIEAIEQDLEDNVQLAVVLEDDPGRDMGMLRQAGHRFFYSPEEVEPLQREER